MDSKNLIEKFARDGFFITSGKEYHDTISPLLNDTIWIREEGNDYHPKDMKIYNIILYQIHLQIATDIVEPYFKDYTIEKRRIWEGVNDNTTEWHNDLREPVRSNHNNLSEGPNCFFLLYHSNMKDDGAIYFKTKNSEVKIYPTEGMLIGVNCKNNFLHRAEKSKNKRIISSYFFNI